VTKFAREIQRLAVQLPQLAANQKLEQFVLGLKPKIRFQVRYLQPASFEEAVVQAEAYEQIVYEPKKAAKQNSLSKFIGDSHALREGSLGALADVRCFACGRKGHMRHQCLFRSEKEAGKESAFDVLPGPQMETRGANGGTRRD